MLKTLKKKCTIIILDRLTIVEFIYLKKPARSAGPVLPPRIERRGTIRHGCMRRIRRRMKNAAPPRHREARRHDRERTGKHREASPGRKHRYWAYFGYLEPKVSTCYLLGTDF
jgi:hypothetical protein